MITTSVFVTLTHVSCCSCHASFGMTTDAVERLKRSHESFYCPYCKCGQSWPGQSDIERAEAAAKRAQELLDQQRAETQRQRERCNQKDRQLSAARGRITKIKNRVGAGVCPCCNRTFSQLANHMKAKHPEYRKDAEGTTDAD